MTLEPISIHQDLKQVVTRGHDFFAALIEPVADQHHYPPSFEKFLDRMTQAGLFGQEHI